MEQKNPNQKYLNKLVSIKVIGKGGKDDFFGRLDNIICFIKENGCKNISFGDVVDIKIIHTTPKCLFSEVMKDGN